MAVMIWAALFLAIVRRAADLGSPLTNSAESRNRGDDGALPSRVLCTSSSTYIGVANAPSINKETAKGMEEEFR
jgi:hypothetical protein